MTNQPARPRPPLPLTVSLVVAWRVGKGYEFGKVHATANFAPTLRGIVRKADAELAERGEPKTYSVGDSLEDDEYMRAPLARQVRPIAPAATAVGDEPVAVAKQPRAVRRTSAMTDDPIEFRRRLVTTMGMQEDVNSGGLAKAVRNGSIAFYAVVSGRAIDERLAYVRHLNPVRLVKPGNFFARLGEALEGVTEPVFAFDDRIDLIIRPDDVIIFDKDFFDSLFFGLSGDGADLDTMVETVLSTLPINTDTKNMVVERLRRRKRSRRKMIEIQQSGHLKDVTLEKFEAALGDHGIDRGRFINAEGIFSSEEDGETLLQILNEDLYKGALTGRRLAASERRCRADLAYLGDINVGFFGSRTRCGD